VGTGTNVVNFNATGSAILANWTTVGTAATLTLNGTTGADTLTRSSTMVTTIDGGTGADNITATKTGDIILQSSGDSLVTTVVSGTTVLTGIDIITASTTATQTLLINLSDMGSTIVDVAAGSLAFGSTVMVGTTANEILIMEGTYSSGIFTAVADGTAGNTHTLVQVDTNGVTAGGIENILLVGVFDDTASNIASEVLTLVV